MTAYEIIKKPIITEHSMDQLADRKYTFEVDKRANKVEIKKAIEEIFGVDVESVKTINVFGKLKRMGANMGRRPSYKKAVVKITQNSKTIEFFDGLI